MKTHWKIILGVLGVVLPSFFTYLAARAESNEAKIRAEVAYVTMQGVVKELQDASYKQALQLAMLEGQLKSDRRVHAEMSMEMPKLGVHPLLPEPKYPLSSDTDGVVELQIKLEPPPDFKQAVKEFKAKE